MYASLLDTCIRRVKYLRRKHREAAYTPDRAHYARRVCRLERCLTWLMRRSPAEVLEEIVEFSPKFKDRVFEALLWAMEMEHREAT